MCICKGISLNHSGVAIGGGVVGDGSSLANCNGVVGLGPSNSRSGSGPGSGRTEPVTGASRAGSGAGEGFEAGSWDGKGDEDRGGHIGMCRRGGEDVTLIPPPSPAAVRPRIDI